MIEREAKELGVPSFLEVGLGKGEWDSECSWSLRVVTRTVVDISKQRKLSESIFPSLSMMNY